MKVWRWCLVLLVFSACAAQPRALVGATAPPRDAARSVPSEVIDDANFALASAGALEGKAFDGWTPGSVAFVIVYPEEQWLFRSPGPLAGYDPRPFDSELGPVYRAPSLTLHDGKRGPNSPPRFFAHTSNFNGQVTFTIAAPSVAPFPASDWATVFVHEYFHAFQMLDERWKGDAPLLAPERRQRLVELYLGDEAVRTTVDRELEVYATLLQALDQGARPDCAGLPELLNARRERAELLRRVDPVLPQVEQAWSGWRVLPATSKRAPTVIRRSPRSFGAGSGTGKRRQRTSSFDGPSEVPEASTSTRRDTRSPGSSMPAIPRGRWSSREGICSSSSRERRRPSRASDVVRTPARRRQLQRSRYSVSFSPLRITSTTGLLAPATRSIDSNSDSA